MNEQKWTTKALNGDTDSEDEETPVKPPCPSPVKLVEPLTNPVCSPKLTDSLQKFDNFFKDSVAMLKDFTPPSREQSESDLSSEDEDKIDSIDEVLKETNYTDQAHAIKHGIESIFAGSFLVTLETDCCKFFRTADDIHARILQMEPSEQSKLEKRLEEQMNEFTARVLQLVNISKSLDVDCVRLLESSFIKEPTSKSCAWFPWLCVGAMAVFSIWQSMQHTSEPNFYPS